LRPRPSNAGLSPSFLEQQEKSYIESKAKQIAGVKNVDTQVEIASN
jgi:hypothetical protein